MKQQAVHSPVFVIGMPRSGTTIVFEAMSRHEALGWPSNYSRMHPRLAWLNGLRFLLDNRIVRLAGRKGQYGGVLPGNRWLPQPDEAYEFWDACCAVPFSRSYLLDTIAGPDMAERVQNAVSGILRWQHRPRFAAKLTGPPRIGFLHSIFPDARFIHVIRDGRAVVHSLRQVRFWREMGGEDHPFWQEGLPARYISRWHESGRDAGVLAALQWKNIIKVAREESRGLGEECYMELRYEDFVADPHQWLDRLFGFSDLTASGYAHACLDRGPALRNMNARHLSDYDEDYLSRLEQVMQPELGRLGYL